MDNDKQALTNPDNLYIELYRLLNEAAARSMAKTEAVLHDETIDMREYKYKQEMMRFISENPDDFIKSLPLQLDGIIRSVATVIARNNQRLLHLISDLVSDEST